ncbi:M15 family metallopeptidase [Paenibacillus wynnii]|uniref:Peptidase M15 n=1 Tax=Paenibacillus wynnii TaxID=268407 RepID=A0A098MGM2_9BACL|nr:M15 family metallopeptidase [Paenibacillus wynnii]KGE20687.1 hypothetical protein PWYN_00375 [Paenibacillus wynnii]
MSLTLEQVKSKSNKRLVGLQPVVLAATLALIERCYKRGVPIVITQGLRTIEEQEALYAQGRTKPGSIVTNAKGGTSYHNYGLAVDFALLLPNGSAVSWDLKRDGDCDKATDWGEVVDEAKELGFEWGGDFTSIKDAPHFQMSFGLTISQLRAGIKPSETALAKAQAKIEIYMKECNDVKAEKANFIVNGVKQKDGLFIDGTVYVPLRTAGEALDATVGWNKDTKTATLTRKV